MHFKAADMTLGGCGWPLLTAKTARDPSADSMKLIMLLLLLLLLPVASGQWQASTRVNSAAPARHCSFYRQC
jgi:hypothetical protein